MIKTITIVALAAALALPGARPVVAQGPSPIAPLPKECVAAGLGVSPTSLPNTLAALKERKRIRILAIGGTSASLRGAVSGGHYAAVERLLETAFRGVNVEIVHRGVSGELATNAAERIKTDVALLRIDLVLWQIGTADVLARVPVDEFKAGVAKALGWLKGHNIDVILIGLRYARSMISDEHYQLTRTAVREVAKEQNVLRIGRYEAEETFASVRGAQAAPISEIEATEASDACTAEYLARAIAAGLFLRDALPSDRPGPSRPAPTR